MRTTINSWMSTESTSQNNMLKNFNVITRHSILTVAAETPAEALQRAHISNNENAFIRECGDSNDSSFIVELVSYSVKRFG